MAQAMSDTQVLDIRNLRIEAVTETGTRVTLVDDVSLALKSGEVLGLIGESGAGKSTIGLSTLVYTRTGCQITGGQILFRGRDLRGLDVRGRQSLRGVKVAYIAQSAAAAFNPAHTIYDQVCEVALQHGVMNRGQARMDAIRLFKELDLPNPDAFGNRYPHQVSGGQLQRAMAAMAMIAKPDLLVFDEPTTALDVTTQVEVLASFKKLIREHRTAALYISHDLAVVAQIADRIMVLRYGKMVELGDATRVLQQPQMEYT
ncbi:MAG: ATP-binding cassette domain-containing protein, partial [Dongiaceae bacterium]